MEQNVLNNNINDKMSYDPTKEDVNNYLKSNYTMYDNRGKYFDAFLFNQKFEEYIEKENKSRLLDEKIRTDDLSRMENINIEPYELPLNKIIINIKNIWFEIFDNAMELKNPFSNFTNDKIFYFSTSLIVISLIYLFFYVLFN
jgi:hypothetical protein